MIGPLTGVVAAEVEAEFPGIAVVSATASFESPKTPPGLRAELAAAADRIDGATAARASAGTVAGAARALLRQLGMDPERSSCTLDHVIRRRLMEGGFRPAGVVADSLTLTVLEMGIPLVAFDGGSVEGPVGIVRAGHGSDRWGAGDLLLADSARPLARLFAEPFPGLEADRHSTAATIVAVAVPGVEASFAELSLERACGLIESG